MYWQLPLLLFLLTETFYPTCCQQVSLPLTRRLTWCNSSPAEFRKCIDLENAISHASVQRSTDLLPIMSCASFRGKRGCMQAVATGDADVMAVEAGDMYAAGRWFGLVPIVIEEYRGVSVRDAAVVVRRSANIMSLLDLRNKSVCSPGATSLAGWSIPTARLMQTVLQQQKGLSSSGSSTVEAEDSGNLDLTIDDCNNVAKVMSNFFGPSCVPEILDFWHNPRSDNPSVLCDRCASNADNAEWCTQLDPYAGNDGVLNCLVHEAGDVGFLSIDLAQKLLPATMALFELLCPDGRKMPLSTELSPTCAWGTTPANTFVVDSSRTSEERRFIQSYIFNLTTKAGKFFSDKDLVSGERRYNGSDLMWTDILTSVRSLPDREQQYTKLFSSDITDIAAGKFNCPVTTMRFCIVGREELAKCLDLQSALMSKNIQPLLQCEMAANSWDCMQRVAMDHADVMMSDASDAYLAGKMYRMVPFMAEIYDLDEPYSYVVAVVKRTDSITTLLDLRERNTCHGQVYGATGWTVPISFLLTQNRIRDAYDCHDLKFQISQIFQKGCAPGVLSSAYYQSVLHPENLCDLCMGDIENYCARNPDEPYYGSTGAFKCLAEGGGHVAFVMHTTGWENTDGHNMRLWARALVSQDYELLCVDGTRTTLGEYATCNLGRVPANALLTSGSKSQEVIAAYAALLELGQLYFGASSSLDFQMFHSKEGSIQDLIFRDATTRLVLLSPENRTVEAYLGEEFVRVLTDRAQCAAAGRPATSGSSQNWMVAMLVVLLQFTNDGTEHW